MTYSIFYYYLPLLQCHKIYKIRASTNKDVIDYLFIKK